MTWLAAKALLGRVPRWAWEIGAAVLAVVTAYAWASHRVDQMKKAAYASGKVDGAKPWIAKTIELSAALEHQSALVNGLAAKSKAQQASAAAAVKQAEPIAKQAEGVAAKLDQSAKVVPAKPCEPSKALMEAWR